MPLPKRLFLTAVLTSLVLLVVPRFLNSDWLPWAQASRLLDELEHSRQQTKQLERQTVVVNWRYQAKLYVIDLLLADQLTFLEAAAWFERINSQPPDLSFPSVGAEPGSREERACRQVLLWVQTQVTRSPNKRASERLQAELFVMAQPGAVVLPEPPELPGLTPCPKQEEPEETTPEPVTNIG